MIHVSISLRDDDSGSHALIEGTFRHKATVLGAYKGLRKELAPMLEITNAEETSGEDSEMPAVRGDEDPSGDAPAPVAV